MPKNNSGVPKLSASMLDVAGFDRMPTEAAPLADLSGTPDDKKKPISPIASAQVLNAQTQTQLPQSWSQYFADKLSFFPYVARTFNVFFYAPVVTAVFALLAIQRANGQNAWAVIYVASAVMFNYFMAIAFNEQLAFFFKGLGKKQRSYQLSFLMGLGLALETTVAGLAVAEEAVNKVGKDLPNSFNFLIDYAIFTFCVNTFATRAVGATNFLHGNYVGVRGFVDRHFLGKGAYFAFKEDLNHYWSQVSTQMVRGTDSEQRFVASFYQALAQNNLAPTRTWSEHAKQVLEFFAVNIPRALAAGLLPMWVGLAENGWRLTGALFGKSDLADKAWLVYLAALSGWLFYMRGAGTFAPSVMKFQQGAKEHLLAAFDGLLSPEFAKGATYVSLAAGWGLILFSAGCSGSGYAVVMHDQLHPAPGTIPANSTDPYAGFGTAAAPLFQIVPFEWAFKHLIVPMGGYAALMASGVFINGGSFVSFVSDCWKIQKDSGWSFRQALLKKMLGIEPEEVVTREEAHAVSIPAEDLPPAQLETLRKKFASAVENCDFSGLVVTAAEIKAARSDYCRMFSSRKDATTVLADPLLINESRAAYSV